MAIPDPVRRNFQVLLDAATNGDLCLVQGKEVKSGIKRYIICAVFNDGKEFHFTPFGHVNDETMGNPFEFYTIEDEEASDGQIKIH
jgi:Family of unknown function (DUF6117)